MVATITRLKTRRDRLRSEQAAALRQLVLDFPDLPEQATNEILMAVDRQTASEHGWIFVMVDVVRHAGVVRWLVEHSHRPKVAVVVWAQCFVDARHDTGEVFINRNKLAKMCGCSPDEISRVMGELVQIGALARHRNGNKFRYFMNPLIATSLTGKARDIAQERAAPLLAS